jgi:hypothetical protein
VWMTQTAWSYIAVFAYGTWTYALWIASGLWIGVSWLGSWIAVIASCVFSFVTGTLPNNTWTLLISHLGREGAFVSLGATGGTLVLWIVGKVYRHCTRMPFKWLVRWYNF